MPILSNAIRQRYRYTCLDQLASGEGAGQLAVQRFYQQGRLTNEVQGQNAWAILQVGEWLLAQRNHPPGSTSLLASDPQCSISHALGSTLSQARYTPYGHRPTHGASPCLLGFTGERAEPISGHYLLGSYRAFNPLLMRFNSPDSFSPFGSGGLNAYAYCAGDPVNRRDPSGHSFFRNILKALTRGSKKTATGSTRVGKTMSPAPAQPYASKMGTWVPIHNYKKLSNYAFSFTNETGDNLSLFMHGTPGKAMLYEGDVGMNGKEFAKYISQSHDLKKVKSITTIVCFSAAADGSAPALGQVVATKLKRPVLSFEAEHSSMLYFHNPPQPSHILTPELFGQTPYRPKTFRPKRQLLIRRA